MNFDIITSAQNPKIKDLITLQSKSKERKSRGLFVIEGQREITRALQQGFIPMALFICEKIAGDISLPESAENARIYSVSENVYSKIAYRGDTEGVIGIFKTKETNLNSLKLTDNPLIIVLESVEKPGNLGAVLRSADAAGADAVIVCDPLTDLYNPNVIRASTGAIFSVQCIACGNEELYKFFQSHHINVYTAQLQDSNLYYDTDMTEATAIIFGTEDKGLTPFWRNKSDAKIRIPMAGITDSLNVSVSAAILCFEAIRQRNIQKFGKKGYAGI